MGFLKNVDEVISNDQWKILPDMPTLDPYFVNPEHLINLMMMNGQHQKSGEKRTKKMFLIDERERESLLPIKKPSVVGSLLRMR